MNNLVVSNLTHHPGRTAASVAGVAVSVILVVLTVGLVRGMLRERGRRDANTGVEILVSHRDQFGLSMTSLPVSLPVEIMSRIREVAGVAGVTPVAQNLEMKGEGGLGIRQVDGVDFDSYAATTTVRIVEGHALPASGAVVIIDVKYAAAHKTKLGDKINILDRDFTVIGVYEPETGARLMIPLTTMQEALGAPGKCSMFLVKLQNPDEQEKVARRIVELDPEFQVIFTRDLPKLFAEGYAGFNAFLDVVAGLAMIISLLIISLTIYTTVTERTRQIGILKSLGASKRFIATVFIKESLAISATGVTGGLVVAALVRAALAHWAGTKVDIEADYTLFAVIGGLASGLIGAIYPALRAASQDPIEALSYE
jgi:putative ABC transport system permease protein